MRATLVPVLAAVLFGATAGFGQTAVPLKYKQAREGGDDVRVLTAAEFATLGDPLFNLVLKDKANVVALDDLEAAIQPDAAKRRLFVVDERIVGDKPAGATRRAALGFVGKNGIESLQGNVMLSVVLDADGKPSADIEAWGWDNHRGRYNYYKLDAAGADAGARVWKFRGSSADADLLTAGERTGTCLACHTTGAPAMKELHAPWNNWHATVGASFRANYLDPTSTAADKWPAAATPRFKQLAGADKLESDFLVPSLKRFNESRVNAQFLRADATGDRLRIDGRLTLVNARRLLAPLFAPTEINLRSSGDPSGLHPLGAATNFLPDKTVLLPDDFFLNTALIAGGPGNVGGLQITAAREFRQFAKLTQTENKTLVEKFKLRLNGVSGDTHFAWLTPTVGFVDVEMADRLVKLGAVSPHFLAAVLAVDLEEPVFSPRRAGLARFVPERFEFVPVADGDDPLDTPRDPATDSLTRAVLAGIDAANPPAGSAAAAFRTLLKSDDAVAVLKGRTEKYAERVRDRLGDAAKRPAELERLFETLVARRRTLLAHPLFRPLDETRGTLLFPLPPAE